MAAGIANLQNQIRRAGGFKKYMSMLVRSKFEPFWSFLQRIPILSEFLNQLYISLMLAGFINQIPRIPRYNLQQDFTSLDVMYDEGRTTYSRLLPRDPEYTRSLPPLEQAASLFERESFTPETNQNLTVLISYYAQWFTHQFFNTSPAKSTETNMPVGINLSQLYGSTKEIEGKIRSYKNGLLKSTFRNGQEFPEIVPVPLGHRVVGKEMFNIPIVHANNIPGFAAVHILFFRRHQYVAWKLSEHAEEHGIEMNDEEIFQKSKIIVALSVLRLTMHDYVGDALQSSHVKIKLDPTVKSSLAWKLFGPTYYPPCNAIQVEFNFLYRWHQLVPDCVKIIKSLPQPATLSPDKIADLEDSNVQTLEFPDEKQWFGEEWNAVKMLADDPQGLEKVLYSAASQRAGKIELMNTNLWLVKNAVTSGIQKCREYDMQSYNAYREYFGFGRVTSFEQITSNKVLQEKLKTIYGHVDNIEFYAGVFAEDKDFGGVHGPFLSTIGVGMTYCGIFASRIFEVDIMDNQVITPVGMDLVNEIGFIRDLTKLHTKLGDARIRFTMPGAIHLTKNKSA